MKTLNTGQSYNLTNILSGENTKIVIPDLQRDYCWGGKNNLVTDFVKNIIEKGFNDNQKLLPMGLLYGYEEPCGHIQLCDGQQRITTLFLLVGMLNKRCNNEFQKLLISDFEYTEDDKEPYLQYSIRESSLYFLSDLVCEFFLKQEGEPCDIKNQSWYFSDYNNDPSIQSIIKALNEIEELLNSVVYKDINASNLAKYITTGLVFMYYDMGNRSSGEETFVVINTTGEPLSYTENLKPRYVTKYPDSSELWEQWEQWFWKNRNREKNDTADNGLLEFLRWVILLETKETKKTKDTEYAEYAEDFKIMQNALVKQAENNRFDYELVLNVEPETIDSYFKIVQYLFNQVIPNNNKWLSPESINTQIEWLRILPLIAYRNEYPNATEREVVRVKQFFKNIAQLANVQKDIGGMLSKAVNIICQMPSPDIALIHDDNNISDVILTEEERLKLKIFSEAANRVEVENEFWKIQYRTDEKNDGKIWQGEIMPILQWSTVNREFSFDEFKKLNNIFFEVFKDTCDGNIDLTRRALITQKLNDYPKCFRGATNKSFGWEYNDWKVLINENLDKFSEFFKIIATSDLSIEDSLIKMCNEFAQDNDWAEFVHIPKLLEYCEKKNIQWWGDKHGWVLVKKKYMSGQHANVNAYKLYLELLKRSENNYFGKWKLSFCEKEGSCIVFDYDAKLIYIKCVSKDDIFDIEVFKRDDIDIESSLKDYAVANCLSFNGKRYVKEGVLKDKVIETVIDML